MKKVKRQGFTLVEIMIVVAIIGLLAAIGIPSFQRARTNSIDTTKENNARILSSAVDEWAMQEAKGDTDPVTQADVVPYIKGGWDAFDLSGKPANFPTLGNQVHWYTNKISVIAGEMY